MPIEAEGKAREHSVATVSLTPHSTHKMQPLDFGSMKPLKTQYAQETETWLDSNSGRVISPVVVCKLFGPAYGRAATIGSFTLLVSCLAWPRSILAFRAPCIVIYSYTRVGTLIVATIYLQLIQYRYMFRSFTVLHCSHQHCVQPVASDVEVVGYL